VTRGGKEITDSCVTYYDVLGILGKLHRNVLYPIWSLEVLMHPVLRYAASEAIFYHGIIALYTPPPSPALLDIADSLEPGRIFHAAHGKE
jgi:hypothetical protein